MHWKTYWRNKLQIFVNICCEVKLKVKYRYMKNVLEYSNKVIVLGDIPPLTMAQCAAHI